MSMELEFQSQTLPPAYVEQEPIESLHYFIDMSLRTGVRSIYEEAIE